MIEEKLREALAALIKVADEMIPGPDTGLSNWQLNEAEKAIDSAHKALADAEKAGPA